MTLFCCLLYLCNVTWRIHRQRQKCLQFHHVSMWYFQLDLLTSRYLHRSISFFVSISTPHKYAPSRGNDRLTLSQNYVIFNRSMSLSTSLPQTSQPSVFCRAKSSIRGRSPHNLIILSFVSSGFLLCDCLGLIKRFLTLLDCLSIFPFIASRQISGFALVQYPKPIGYFSPFF